MDELLHSTFCLLFAFFFYCLQISFFSSTFYYNTTILQYYNTTEHEYAMEICPDHSTAIFSYIQLCRKRIRVNRWVYDDGMQIDMMRLNKLWDEMRWVRFWQILSWKRWSYLNEYDGCYPFWPYFYPTSSFPSSSSHSFIHSFLMIYAFVLLLRKHYQYQHYQHYQHYYHHSITCSSCSHFHHPI